MYIYACKFDLMDRSGFLITVKCNFVTPNAAYNTLHLKLSADHKVDGT